MDSIIENGWLISLENGKWVCDDEVENKYYFDTKEEAVMFARTIE